MYVSNYWTTGIFRRSNVEGNCVNVQRYRKTAAEVCGTWCTKMMPACCFLLALEAMKWPSKIHQSSEKCIYFQTRLFVPSLKVGRDFSIDMMPQASLIAERSEAW